MKGNENHISSHTENSFRDSQAVHGLQSLLEEFGRIKTEFACDDKWPNTDGRFELISDPEISNIPSQSFIVQIKSTTIRNFQGDDFTYQLKDLAFPQYIRDEVTADPGILFVVLLSETHGEKRYFWKYMSPHFLHSIDFAKKNSIVVKFSTKDEIINTYESNTYLCKQLERIKDIHLFLNKLDKTCLNKESALRIIDSRNIEVTRLLSEVDNESRDAVSRSLLKCLYDLCYATLILNAIRHGHIKVNEQFAWDLALFDINTNYLCRFLKGLKYVGVRIPDDGQSERLMLKYYNYLWEIRRFLKEFFNKDVLGNLENFPLNTDKLDIEYYNTIAHAIDANKDVTQEFSSSRYYVQRITPFFVNHERYFEITLQLANIYSTKYNRITIYTKCNIFSKYSIRISYSNVPINLFGVKSSIKVVTDWSVSIEPKSINIFGEILRLETRISSNYREYTALMKFLTSTGLNILDIIDLDDNHYHNTKCRIFDGCNTNILQQILDHLHTYYGQETNCAGHNTIRYLLIHLREDTLSKVLPNQFDKLMTSSLYLPSRCYPFDRNPFISNLTKSKTTKIDLNELIEVCHNSDKIQTVSPYLRIEHLIRETKEIFFDPSTIATDDEIDNYNASLDQWERRNGFGIIEHDGKVAIKSYFESTINILKSLIQRSMITNDGQMNLNESFIRKYLPIFNDQYKKKALKYAFVNSRILLIYGAAGTGKTYLINCISNLMNSAKKLFLTKTHTAVQNLQRCVENPGPYSEFICIDSFTKRIEPSDFDLIFVDECSTIDNRVMEKLLNRVNNNTFLVLAGDVYQIESIEFGNWFYFAKEIIKTEGSCVELFSTWRTDIEELKSLWAAVRNRKHEITEKLALDGPFSSNIGEDIFIPKSDDEIVLCLNYDGKFGLNNINQYFQNANNGSIPFTWGDWTYKIGDPILFLDTNRSKLLYNNLKGKIVNIEKQSTQITFTIDIETILTAQQCTNENFDFITSIQGGTRIRLSVLKNIEFMDEEQRKLTVVPFQIAYAVSIHKAQGLEYKSVKIIIPSTNAEKITHSIFYTAITRAKEKLQIYCSSETISSIIKEITSPTVKQQSIDIIKEELGIQY